MSFTTPSTSTEAPPLRFHSSHGKNVRVSSDGTLARRTAPGFFTRGLLFSSRPVAVNERVSFTLVEVAGDVGGFLYVGFTSRDPATLRGASCAALADKPGYWSWFFPKQLCARDAVLFYRLTAGGEVRYGADGAERGAFGGRVPPRGPLWALLDIFGNANAVRLAEPRTPAGFLPLPLHRAHGRDVRARGRGCVFAHRPLRARETVAAVAAQRGPLQLGVTARDPAELSPDEPLEAHWALVCEFPSLGAGDEASLAAADGRLAFGLNGARFGGAVQVDRRPLWVFASSALPLSLFSRQEKGDGGCVVCLDGSVETALYKCGHACMCYDCALQQWRGKGLGRCPLCRAVIKDVIRTSKPAK